VSQQFEISDAVGVVGQNYLSGVATLRNMMGDVDNNDARQAGHEKKVSEMIPPKDKVLVVFGCRCLPIPRLGVENWGTSRLSPGFPPSGLEGRKRIG
jgi:hypothetical protein